MKTRAPKRAYEQLTLPAQRRDKNGQRRGSTRKGAGRKKLGLRDRSPHKRRPDVNHRFPQHVVLRVVRDVGWLRKRSTYRAIRAALLATLRHHEFRIVHFSLQNNHVHLLCEAADRMMLARGLQGFQISAARRLNAAVSRHRPKRRRGRVFADRYHVTSISSVRQTRHALAYVMNNWRHHKQDHAGIGLFGERIDPYSSGLWYPGWRERTIELLRAPRDYDPPPLCVPETWLLAEGWKRAKSISVYEVPG